MKTILKRQFGLIRGRAGMTANALLISLFLIIFGGCDNPDSPASLRPPGEGPEISLSVVTGGEIMTQSNDEADILVYRDLSLTALVLFFSIDIPNGYSKAVFNTNRVETNEVIFSNDRTVTIIINVWEVQSGVPLTFGVYDKSRKYAEITINPIFRIDLLPEDITPGKWAKSGFDYLDEYDIGLLTATSDNSILAVSGHLIRKSSDGGLSWKEIDMPFLDLVNWIRQHPSGDLYAVSYSKIARSSDNGDTWSVLSTNLPGGIIGDMGIRPDGSFLLPLNRPNNESGIYVSEDGIDWSKLSAFQEQGDEPFCYFREMIIINDTTTLLQAYECEWGGEIIMRSDDSGITWYPQDVNYLGSRQIILASDGSVYESSINYGIRISKDQGMTWKVINRGIPMMYGQYSINGIAEGTTGQIYVLPKDFGVFVLDESEERWKSVGTDLAPYNVKALLGIEGTIFAVVQYNGLYQLN